MRLRPREEDDREFQGFIDAISVTAEELAAIVSMPEFSIQEVKKYLQDGKNKNPQSNRSSVRRAVPSAGYRVQSHGRPLPGAQARRHA